MEVNSVQLSPSLTIMSGETSPAILAPTFNPDLSNEEELPFAQISVKQAVKEQINVAKRKKLIEQV